MNLALRTRLIDFKGHRFEKTIILTGVRWYLAYPLSYRDLEEMMEEAVLITLSRPRYETLVKRQAMLSSAGAAECPSFLKAP